MGEVHLDTENLFHPFGWTPTRSNAPERAKRLRSFDVSLTPTVTDDIRTVQSLGRTVVLALTAWAEEWLRSNGARRDASLSYGKLDPGVTSVLDTLELVGYEHIIVPPGKDEAEDALLHNLRQRASGRGPFIVGSSDARVAEGLSELLQHEPASKAILVIGPAQYNLHRLNWFDSTDPEAPPKFPLLRGYGAGYAALHLIAKQWIDEQSRSRARTASPGQTVDRAPLGALPEQRWERWHGFRLPIPRPDRPLSSTTWVKACRQRQIPAEIFRTLRDDVVRLYGDGFETGSGPVPWPLACQAAVALPQVLADPTLIPSPSDQDDRAAAYREAWGRLMTRSVTRSNETGLSTRIET